MRKKKSVVVPAGFGRDTGKTFLITEKSALDAERWAWAAVAALKGTSGQISPQTARLGYVGVAIAAINAFLAAEVDPQKFNPLLDEMLACVTMIRDPRKHPDVVTALRVDLDDIEEVRTLAWLRSEIIELHAGFSPAEILSTWISALQEVAKTQQSLTTPTSPSASDAPSPAASSA